MKEKILLAQTEPTASELGRQELACPAGAGVDQKATKTRVVGGKTEYQCSCEPGLLGKKDTAQKNLIDCLCKQGEVFDSKTKKCIKNDYGNLGIQCDSSRLLNGQCSFSIYKALGIRVQDQTPSPEVFIQDVISSLTFFIGTVVTIALVYSGLLYIFAGADDNQASEGKSGIRYAIIGYMLVIFSYVIIRLVQYIAKGA